MTGRIQIRPRLDQIGEALEAQFGLVFPEARREELMRALRRAAAELGLHDEEGLIVRILEGRLEEAERQAVVDQLTVGETYFFRDAEAFQELEMKVLRPLVEQRRGKVQRLRLWSAGCCTGEEAYSLAMVVRRVLPDLEGWNVSVLATDLNTRYLEQAMAGAYGEWSFRDVAPALKTASFSRLKDGRHLVREEVRRMVTFAPLNLVDDCYPALATGTNAMDVIFCRNVLMYFSAGQVAKVVDRFHRCLVDGGSLWVGPAEVGPWISSQWTTCGVKRPLYYEKRTEAMAYSLVGRVREIEVQSLPPAGARSEHRSGAAHPVVPPPGQPGKETSGGADYRTALEGFHAGRYGEAVEILQHLASVPGAGVEVFELLARTMGNAGCIEQALLWCDQWTSADKLDRSGHYVRAMLLMERGELQQARSAMRRVLYLDPDFILAHVALGNLDMSQGFEREAADHFSRARRLLRAVAPGEVLPESDGLTAGRLSETLELLCPEVMSSHER